MDFGVASGIAGFASLLIQISAGIKKLRDILNNAEQAPAELEQLVSELVFLQHLMEGAKGLSPDPAFEHCEATCGLFVQGLDRLYQKLLTDSEKLKGPKMVKTLMAFRHWKRDVEDLLRSIQAAKINLLLLTSHRTSQCLSEMMLVNQLHNMSTQLSISATASDSAVAPRAPAASTSLSPGSLAPATSSLDMAVPRPRARGNCLSRYCPCSCHRTEKASRRFWALEYSPLTVFQQGCDVPSCNAAKYGGSFRIALSQLGVRWAAAIQFYIVAESGKFSMRPCFDMERIVPYTSPGFELIWTFENGLIEFEEARTGLLDLQRTDPTFPTHVNPGGKSYIEVILQRSWQTRLAGFHEKLDKKLQLLSFFMQELKTTKGTERPGFLSLCASWINEGYHMHLLKTLLGLGFDATLADTQDWPQIVPTIPIFATHTPDPFFVEYLSVLSKDNQGFSGLTPLHEAVICGPPNLIRKLASRYDINERNFLGQTPLHFAVSNPLHTKALLESNPELDAPDNYGNTPLMYAAAGNQEEAAMMLIDAGADLNVKDSRCNFSFIAYGARRQHWKLVLNCLTRIETVKGKHVAEIWAQSATALFCTLRDWRRNEEVTLDQFLLKCTDVNFHVDDPYGWNSHNTLLHYASSVSELEALIENGFNLINHTNSLGKHPLIPAVLQGNPSLVEGLCQVVIETRVRSKHTNAFLLGPR
ncbi:ankyrin [Colletotrichum zoysiae]|uniref:Ankyrin n=1 Tax=Colletotrichum zoysiae TaxID=1216348 RepID=A0AAD9H1Y5_9PEZI|nr:ankyrin [Colletotrichum zoysiae]